MIFCQECSSQAKSVKDSGGNEMVVEDVKEEPTEDFFKNFFSEFIVGQCNTKSCQIDYDKLKESFWNLFKKDRHKHAAALALLSPAILNNLGQLKNKG